MAEKRPARDVTFRRKKQKGEEKDYYTVGDQ